MQKRQLDELNEDIPKFCIPQFHNNQYKLTIQLVKQDYHLLIIKLLNKNNPSVNFIRKTKLNWNKYIWKFFKDGQEFFEYFKSNPKKIQYNDDMRLIFKVEKRCAQTDVIEAGQIQIQMENYYYLQYENKKVDRSQNYPGVDYDQKRLQKKIQLIFQEKRKKDMLKQKKMQKKIGFQELELYNQQQNQAIDKTKRRYVRRNKIKSEHSNQLTPRHKSLIPQPTELLRRIRQLNYAQETQVDNKNYKNNKKILVNYQQQKQTQHSGHLKLNQNDQSQQKSSDKNIRNQKANHKKQDVNIQAKLMSLQELYKQVNYWIQQQSTRIRNKQLRLMITPQADFTQKQLSKSISFVNIFTDGFKLPTMAFINLFRNIKNLQLKSNSIAKIQALESCLLIQVLDLSNNQIQKICGLENSCKMKKLILNHNSIIQIEGIFHLIDLSCLHLSCNLINKVAQEITKLKKLADLRLRNNKISEIPMSLTMFPQLKLLSLNENPIFIHSTLKRASYRNKSQLQKQNQFLNFCEIKAIKMIDKQ